MVTCYPDCDLVLYWLQKAYDEVSQHSRHCESERDTLRKEKETWSERIAEMESKLERTMAEISNLEQARKTIETELQSTKVCV